MFIILTPQLGDVYSLFLHPCFPILVVPKIILLLLKRKEHSLTAAFSQAHLHWLGGSQDRNAHGRNLEVPSFVQSFKVGQKKLHKYLIYQIQNVVYEIGKSMRPHCTSARDKTLI